MSWSFSFSCTALDFDDESTLAFSTWRGAVSETEAHDQASAALNAAKVLVHSGAIHHRHGTPKGLYDVALSGHANPGHIPREGWAHDVVTVTVRQAIPPTHVPNFEPAPMTEASQPTPNMTPFPSPANPVPVEVAKEAAPAWEEQAAPQKEPSSGA